MKYNKIWLKEPEEHDYLAAKDYLELVLNNRVATNLAYDLELAKEIKLKKAKDILRASQLELLPANNIHVKSNIKKVKEGKKLSPILLIVNNNKLIIADGYHRLCAIYYLSEDLNIPCKIVWK